MPSWPPRFLAITIFSSNLQLFRLLREDWGKLHNERFLMWLRLFTIVRFMAFRSHTFLSPKYRFCVSEWSALTIELHYTSLIPQITIMNFSRWTRRRRADHTAPVKPLSISAIVCFCPCLNEAPPLIVCAHWPLIKIMIRLSGFEEKLLSSILRWKFQQQIFPFFCRRSISTRIASFTCRWFHLFVCTQVIIY